MDDFFFLLQMIPYMVSNMYSRKRIGVRMPYLFRAFFLILGEQKKKREKSLERERGRIPKKLHRCTFSLANSMF